MTQRTSAPPHVTAPEPAPDVAPGPPPTAHAGAALAVIVGCWLMIGIDASIVTIAVPALRDALGFGTESVSWVLNAYTLTFGGLLLLGSRAGDRFGRRRVLVIGVAVFTLASVAGGLAGGAGVLVAARAAQGVGGALVGPNLLALLATTFPEGPPRNRALGIYSATASAGISLGMVAGGVITGLLTWRWIFFVSVPLGAVLAVAVPRVLPETPAGGSRELDVPGAVLATAGVTAVVYACIRAASDGWGDGVAIVTAAAGAVLLAAFVAVERRAAAPLVPLRLFAARNRNAGFATLFLVGSAMIGTMFTLTQFVQDTLGFGAITAGLAFLPTTLTMFAVVRTVPRMLARVGPRPVLVTGALSVAAASLWLTRLDGDDSYAGAVLGPLLLLGLGVGMTFMPVNSVVLTGVAPRVAGATAGLLQTVQWAGGSLGLAVLVAVASAGMAEMFAATAAMALVAAVLAAVVVRPAVSPSPAGAGSGRSAAP